MRKQLTVQCPMVDDVRVNAQSRETEADGVTSRVNTSTRRDTKVE